jgi:hypothetical protein
VTADNGWCLNQPVETCGGMVGAVCGSDKWCDYPANMTCGWADGMGECRPKPTGCPEDCPGVCGCDLQFYCNECMASVAGVDITGGNECIDYGGDVGAPCGTVMDCNTGLLCCYPCGQPGCTNECMDPDPNGSCPMFP